MTSIATALAGLWIILWSQGSAGQTLSLILGVVIVVLALLDVLAVPVHLPRRQS